MLVKKKTAAKKIQTISPRNLFVKKSHIPGAGKGLFTKQAIAKGSHIIRYQGTVTTWKKVQDSEVFNGYVFYVNRNHVVDAMNNKKALGRYANDAKGLVKITGLRNNAGYVIKQKKVYIVAATNIAAGAEILVRYGKEYWDVIRYNKKIDAANNKKK